MEQKICLDTDVIIDFINGKSQERIERLLKLTRTLPFVSSVSVFELSLRTTNLDRVDAFLKDVRILNFDSNAARAAAFILKELKKKGAPLEMRDLFIAGICITYGCKIMTNNKDDFSRVSGLEVI